MTIFKTLFLVGALLTITGCDGGIDPELEAATADREPNIGIHLVHPSNENLKTMRIAKEHGMTPAGTKLVPYPEYETELLINERTRINQDCMGSAKEGLHPENNLPILNFKFDDKCKDLFGKLTKENFGKRFAVVVDGKIVSAPMIRSAITGGSAFFGGFATMQDARELAYMINRHARDLRLKAEKEQNQ